MEGWTRGLIERYDQRGKRGRRWRGREQEGVGVPSKCLVWEEGHGGDRKRH